MVEDDRHDNDRGRGHKQHGKGHGYGHEKDRDDDHSRGGRNHVHGNQNCDVLTGKNSVLDYLLKPMKKARERALREQ